MKRIMTSLLCFTLWTAAGAQDSVLVVTTDKTSALIFPASIRHVDRGRADLLVQQPPAAENLLLIKAAHEGMGETNLSVLTSDGKLYSFTVLYSPHPPGQVYRLGAQVSLDKGLDAQLERSATMILDNPRRRGGMVKTRWGMEIQLKGIYVSGAALLLHFSLANQSPIDYDLAYLTLHIRDAQRSKRTAVQEKEVMPLKSFGTFQQVGAGRQTNFVLALSKFTLPEAQYLALEMGEQDGGRHLNLKIRNHHLMKAVPLPLVDTQSPLK